VTTAPLLVQVLELAGRPWRACRYCGRVFEPDRAYNGRRHSPQRLYCSPECRDLCRTRRRAPRRALVRKSARNYAQLRAMHAQEDAGHLAIGDPLPPVPQTVGA
jgi:hypothetical protein